MHNGVLCYNRHTDPAKPCDTLHICTPAVKVNEVFKICHEGLTAGQSGVAGTLHKFQRTFFIMSAHEKIRKLVEPCDVCLAKERSIKVKRVPHEPSTVGNVGEKVFIDCFATSYANEHELFIPEEVSIHPCN